jgi:hypothetical protein
VCVCVHVARAGTGVLIVPQKPWRMVKEETELYRSTYRQAIGDEPLPPIVAGWTFVDDNAGRAEEQARACPFGVLPLLHA